MDESQLDDLFERLISELEASIKEQRPHEAIVGGLLAYLFFREKITNRMSGYH
jgi:hypothetical protein